MTSAVDICNRGLSKLGASRITSLTDDTKAAKACNNAYESVRDFIIRVHPWNSTVKRVQLAPLSDAPVYGYTYRYQWPSDCIKVLEVDTTYSWVSEGREILTDEGTVLKVRYQRCETDPNQFDRLLVETIAARLAFEISEELTQSNSKKQAALRDYEQILKVAKLNDAQEGSPSTFAEDDWINARY